MARMVGVGLVGCGRIARMFHLRILSELPGVELLAVADADAGARSAAISAAPRAAAAASLDELLEVTSVEAVVVCLPSHLHADAAVSAFAAGKHVYVEKPLATGLADAERVRVAWRASGRVGAVGLNLRFHPLYARLREVVRAGTLGRVVAVRSAFSSAPRDLPAWKRSRATGGGALLDLGSHHVDLIRYVLGAEVTAASAQVRSVGSDEDTAALTLELDSGVVAQALVTLSAAQADRFEVLGDTATARVDRMTSRRIDVVPAHGATSRRERMAAARGALVRGMTTTVDGLRPPPEASFAAALSAFAAAVGGAPQEGATIEDGYRCLAVLEAAERAAATGRRVALEAPAPVAHG